MMGVSSSKCYQFEQLLAEDGDKHTTSIDEESRQTLTSLLADNGALRKQVNSLIVKQSQIKGER